MWKKIFSSWMSVLILPLTPGILGAQSLQTGIIIDKVVCRANPNQSYALYLPSAYSPQDKWPILFAFDPAARGRTPVERFKPAAEQHGYIIAGSNNSKNGPWEPIFNAMAAMWNDAHDRFSVDEKRVYATGFSGGARGASYLSQVVFKPVAGIIACGAGLAPRVQPEHIKPGAFVGVVATRDFNYLEFMNLDKVMDTHEVQHRIFVFEGSHSWPPAKNCTRALEWLHAVGMKEGIVPVDEEVLDRIFAREMAAAEQIAESGHLSRAASDYEAILSVFEPWQDRDNIVRRINRIRQSADYHPFLKQETERQRDELRLMANSRKVFQSFDKMSASDLNPEQILTDLETKSLLEIANKNKTPADQNMAFRLLSDITLSAERGGWTSLDSQNYPKALLFFTIASRASEPLKERHKFIHYGLACVHSRMNNTEEALTHLKRAVESGFTDAQDMAQNEHLDTIRQQPRFKAILKKLKKA